MKNWSATTILVVMINSGKLPEATDQLERY